MNEPRACKGEMTGSLRYTYYGEFYSTQYVKDEVGTDLWAVDLSAVEGTRFGKASIQLGNVQRHLARPLKACSP